MVPAVEVDSINIVEAMAEKFRAALLRQDVAIWNFYDLAEIFFDVDGTHVTQAKWHYHDCRTHLFVDAFSRQTGHWCGRHGLQFTGHCLVEDTLSAQVMATGNCMRFYEHQQFCRRIAFTVRGQIVCTDTVEDLMHRTDGRHVVQFCAPFRGGVVRCRSLPICTPDRACDLAVMTTRRIRNQRSL